MDWRVWLMVVAILLVAGCRAPQPAPEEDEMFAAWGEAVFRLECARCHESDRVAPLTETRLVTYRDAENLYEYIRETMPLDKPGALPDYDYRAVTTYLLVEGAREIVPVADPDRGRVAFVEYGCPACHTIPGVTGARAHVGPPLEGWAERRYIAGRLPNTPENLVTWIMSPQAVDPGNAMPDVGVPEVIARDMAAYLYALDAE